MPEKGFSGRGGSLQIWRPLTFTTESRTRDYHWLEVVARLKSGVTLDHARANMNTIGARIAQNYPHSNKDWGVTVDRMTDLVRSQYKTSFYILLGAVGMVLLIGCANLANLMLVRGMTRQREVAIRSALGAGSGRLIRQFLTESLLLSLVGGALGLALGYAILTGLKIRLRFALPAEVGFSLDGRVLLFTLLLAILTGVLCGIMPALQTRRPDLTSGLKQGGGAGAGRSQHRTRATLVVAEVALAFVLLAGAGLLLRTFAQLQKVDIGFDANNVITAGFPLPQERFTEPAAMNEYLRQVREAVAALPGVRDVAFTSSLPMQYGPGMPFQRADKPIENAANRSAAIYKMVSASYFHTLGLNLIAGRTLTEQDTQDAHPVIVINEAMRKKHFADENPIGKHLLIQKMAFGGGSSAEIPWEIVGIVADEKVGWVGDKRDLDVVYVTTEQNPQPGQALMVSTESDPGLLYQPLRATIKKINSDQVLPELKTVEQIKNESLGDNRLMIVLLGTFAGIALLLAAIGIYGVISYSVAQRTREIGVRSALGADADSILRLVLYGGMKTVTVGLILGAVGVFAFSGLMASLLFGISKHDPLTFSCVAVLLAGTALIACYLPARRAAKVDPLVALRVE